MLSRLAHLAHSRPRRLVAAALAVAVVAGAFGFGVASKLGPYSADDPASQSYKAAKDLSRATGLAVDDTAVVLVRTGAPLSSPAAHSKVDGVVRTLTADRGIGRVASWYGIHDPAMVSKDGRSTYLVGSFRKGADQTATVKRLERDLRGRPGVTLGGSAAASVDANRIVQQDLAHAELLAFPLLFLLSFWFFRSLVASLLPPLVGGLAIVITFLGLRIVNEYVHLSVFALNLVTGLGLGLAIDYSLFVVSRYREEVARHGAGLTALENTVRSAGRTVLFSSLTVAAAMASLVVFPQRFLMSMGVGGALVALVACSVALLVLPAVLALLGTRVNALSVGRLRRAADAEARHEAHGFWYRLSRFVMRRPARVAVTSAVLLVALGIPFLGIKFTAIDATVLPKDKAPRQVDTALCTEFAPDHTAPIVLAVHGSPAEARQVAQRVGTLREVAAVSPPQQVAPQLAMVDAISRGSELSDSSQRAVRQIRSLDLPVQVGVTGRTAHFVDQKVSLASHLAIALPIVATTTFLILFLFTGSVVLPLKALVMNALTLSAAFGLLVLIFQDGRFQGLLGYTTQHALESSQPVFLFAVAFGLSTDYGVFLLSRIKEARDAGASDREAVAVGLERTGRIVTAAAVLFCVAIGAFATSRIVFIKELGVGTALAVLIDATIVRALLVPSLMELLGRWNWWAPRPLRWLHARFGLAEGGPPVAAGAR